MKKRWLSLMLVCAFFMCLLPGAVAAAEYSEGEQTSPVTVDLDGDGVEETLSVLDIPHENGETYIGIEIKKGAKRCAAETEIIGPYKLFLTDLDGDGLPEILLSGDFCSDDYITYCWRYKEDRLLPVPFENDERLCGGISAVSPHTLDIFRTIDALGTYTGYTDMWYEGGRIVFDETSWRIGGEDYAYTPVLLAKQDIYVLTSVGDEGEYGEETTLEAGTTIYLLETDGNSYVTYRDENGAFGVILLEKDESGWPVLVNGLPEGEVFEGIEYAD